MFLGASVRAMFAVLCLGHLVAGCSWWDEDTSDHVDFALPSITFTVSPSDPQWRKWPSPNTPVPGFVCSGPEALSTDCCAPPYDCQRYPFACDPTTHFCALTFAMESAQTVDLVEKSSAVAAVRGHVFSRVELLSLSTLVDLSPELPIRSASLYVGPGGLAASTDPAATFFASVILFPEAQPVVPDLAGQQAFSNLARDYEAPFSVLLSAHVVIPNDDSPKGTFSATLSGQARAYY
jgi:hypothetical protein